MAGEDADGAPAEDRDAPAARSLPMVTRNIGVLGRPPAGAADQSPSTPGVLSHRIGLLQPSLPADEWPPTMLSHLALADLLGDSLGRAKYHKPFDSETSGTDTTSDNTDADAEPTVREVLQREAAGEPTAAADNPVTMSPRESVVDRRGEASAGELASTEPGETSPRRETGTDHTMEPDPDTEAAPAEQPEDDKSRTADESAAPLSGDSWDPSSASPPSRASQSGSYVQPRTVLRSSRAAAGGRRTRAALRDPTAAERDRRERRPSAS